MADKKITQLNPLAAANIAAADVVAVADVSANETRKVTTADLTEAGLRLLPSNSIDGDKLIGNSVPGSKLEPGSVTGGPGGHIALDTITADNIAPNAIGSSELANGAVDTAAIQNGAVTGSKIADDSINTAHIVAGGLENGAYADSSITYDKTAFADGDIPGAKITDDSITAQQIAPEAIGASELANNSVDTNAIVPDAVIGGAGGSIAADTITSRELAANSVGSDEIADNSVDTAAIQNGAVTGVKLDPGAFDRGIDLTNNFVGITNSIVPGTFAGITYDEQGLITAVSGTVPGGDIQIATQTTLGVVAVPAAGGLAVTGTGDISIANTVTAGTGYKVSYDNHGLVTGSSAIDAADLPLATSTTPGAVSVPSTPLDIAADGSLTHSFSGVAAGTYTKVIVDEFGHVTVGGTLAASDIPDLSFDQITSGEIPNGALGDCAVEASNLCDYATVLMQEDNPGAGEYLGQLWWTPSTSQLRVYARGSGPENVWRPVGFGALQANNLRWGGTYDADTDTIVTVTSIGAGEGITAGQAFPTASDAFSGLYFICQNEGSSMTQPDLNGISHSGGDWALCLDGTQGWVHIDITNGGGGGGGGAQFLNDLQDVEIGGSASPFSTAPAVALTGDHILRYDGGSGLWRNTDIIDGGSID